MQINHLISHFDKTYTFGGFSVGLTINEDDGTSNAHIFVISKGEMYQSNFMHIDGFKGDSQLTLDSDNDTLQKTMRESVQGKLTDWLYANGY